MLGSTLLVQPGRSPSTVDVAASNPLEDHDTWFIPCQLQGKRCPLQDCPPFSQNNDEAGLTVSWNKRTRHVRFPGRYSDVVPLRLQSTTFLLVTGSSPESRGYAAIRRCSRQVMRNVRLSGHPVSQEAGSAKSNHSG